MKEFNLMHVFVTVSKLKLETFEGHMQRFLTYFVSQLKLHAQDALKKCFGKLDQLVLTAKLNYGPWIDLINQQKVHFYLTRNKFEKKNRLNRVSEARTCMKKPMKVSCSVQLNITKSLLMLSACSLTSTNVNTIAIGHGESVWSSFLDMVLGFHLLKRVTDKYLFHPQRLLISLLYVGKQT